MPPKQHALVARIISTGIALSGTLGVTALLGLQNRRDMAAAPLQTVASPAASIAPPVQTLSDSGTGAVERPHQSSVITIRPPVQPPLVTQTAPPPTQVGTLPVVTAPEPVLLVVPPTDLPPAPSTSGSR